MTAHTPGPWAHDGDGDIHKPHGDYITYGHGGQRSFVKDADAILASAAPELLEALEAAVAFIDSHVADPDITQEMRDAWTKLQEIDPIKVIAKARGEK